MRSDLKYLKWKLMHKEGLSLKEASNRITKLIEWENKGKDMVRQSKIDKRAKARRILANVRRDLKFEKKRLRRIKEEDEKKK